MKAWRLGNQCGRERIGRARKAAMAIAGAGAGVAFLLTAGFLLLCESNFAVSATCTLSPATHVVAPVVSGPASAHDARPGATSCRSPCVFSSAPMEECKCPDGILLSPEGGEGFFPDVAVDRLGRAHIVWVGQGLWYARLGAGRGIQVPPRVMDTAPVVYARVACDAAGNAHVVASYEASPSLLYIKVSGAFEAEPLVRSLVCSWGDNAHWPSIDVNPITQVPVIAAELRGCYYTCVSPGGCWYFWTNSIIVVTLDVSGNPVADSRWEPLYRFQYSGPPLAAQIPDVAVDSLGRRHCVWLAKEPEWSDYGIGYAREGTDYCAEIAGKRNVNSSAGGPKITRGEEGLVEIVWSTRGGTVEWRSVDHDGSTLFDHGTVSDLTAGADRPNITAHSGKVFFAWSDGREGGQSQLYGRNLPDDADDRRISCTGGSAFNVALSARGGACVDCVWQDNRNGLPQVYYLSLPPPVILVHGWNPKVEGGHVAVWKPLMARLNEEKEKIEHYEFDYAPANKDPREYAEELKGCIEQKRKETGYTGKFDIVCHSMGALVSRWYMERLDGAKDIRQWIGIAPANHGVALVDKPTSFLAWLLTPLVESFLLWVGGDRGAVPQLRTDSDTVTGLENADAQRLKSCVIYRVIAGVNRKSKTVAMVKDSNDERHYGSTWLGDGVIALEQSRLTGAGQDCFDGWDHNRILENEQVLDTIIGYVKDPTKPLSCRYYRGEAVTEDCLPQSLEELDASVPASGNRGWIYKAEVKQGHFLVDSSVEKATVGVSWSGSKLSLTVTSPRGTIMQAGTYPVVEYTKRSDAVWYVLDAPEPGIWTAQIVAVDVPEEGEEYVFMVYYSSDLWADLTTAEDKFAYGIGERATIVARISDQDVPVTGATVSADVKRPDGLDDRLTLYDDGTHGDAVADDGAYTNTYSLSMPGFYEIIAFASGTAYGGFERMAFSTILVETPLQVSSIRPNQDGTVSLGWEPEQVDVEAEHSTDLKSWTVFPGAVEEGGVWRSTLSPSGNLGFFRLKMR